jgi:hypothetical protein
MAYGSTGSFGGYTTNDTRSTTAGSGLELFLMREGIPSNILPLSWPQFAPDLGYVYGPARELLDQNAGRPSRTYQWNFSLQREITRNFVIEASYVGNRGFWQAGGSGMSDHNAIGMDVMNRYGFDTHSLTQWQWFNTATMAPVAGAGGLSTTIQSTLKAMGVDTPYPTFPKNLANLAQSLRPYPQWSGAITPQRAPLGRTWYDSLQVSVNKRYSHGLMINANYTLGKNLSATSRTDVFNPYYGNKDLSSSNVPQRLRVTFQYQTPRPPRWLPVLGNRWVGTALEGWGVAMTMSYASGSYVGRAANVSANSISTFFGGRGSVPAQLKKNPDGTYMNPWSKDWVDLDGNRHTDPLDINCHCFDPLRTNLLDPTVWENVPNFEWAADVARIPSYRGPRRPSESGNISRNFRFGKDGRFTLNVRAEFQNIFNRLLLPASIGGATSAYNVRNTVQNGTPGYLSGGFGNFGGNAVQYGQERSGNFIGRLTF